MILSSWVLGTGCSGGHSGIKDRKTGRGDAEMGLPAERIKGEELTRMLREWIRSRQVCRMEIRDTEHAWFTLLLGIKKGKDSSFLVIDRVAGIERALAGAKTSEISIRFFERDGVRCSFTVRVLRCLAEQIHADLPETIDRLQRRAAFRLEALSGTEIGFQVEPLGEVRGKVRDYSLGGLSFYFEKETSLGVDDRVTGLRLQLSGSGGMRVLSIPRAVIRRIEMDGQGKRLCALEFLELPRKTKEDLWTHLIEMQRKVLAKLNKG
jgi:c-di-GMP-binding flagellar brake protein YcgR